MSRHHRCKKKAVPEAGTAFFVYGKPVQLNGASVKILLLETNYSTSEININTSLWQQPNEP